MSNQITQAEPNNPLVNLDLSELIEQATMVTGDIKSNIVFLGNILSEIGRRYGHDGIDIVIKKIGLSKKAATRLVAAYRGTMHPAIAMGGISHADKIEKLTLEDQTDVIENGVPFIERVGKTYKTKRVQLEKLSSEQIKQVFDGQKLRSEDEQFQYLKELQKANPEEKKEPRDSKPVYEFVDGKLVVHKPHKFDAKELMREIANQI